MNEAVFTFGDRHFVPRSSVKESVKTQSNLLHNVLSIGEKLSLSFEARDFVPIRGVKSGVMQRIMNIFVTKSRDKRSASNAEVIFKAKRI